LWALKHGKNVCFEISILVNDMVPEDYGFLQMIKYAKQWTANQNDTVKFPYDSSWKGYELFIACTLYFNLPDEHVFSL